MSPINERRLLQYIYEDSLGSPQPGQYKLLHSQAAAASGMTEIKVEECLRRFALRGWIRRAPAMDGFHNDSFFAVITPEGMREVEDRPYRVAVDGSVSVSIDAIAGLGLDSSDAERVRELIEAAGQPGDAEERQRKIREAMSIASDGVTLAQGLGPFLYSLALLTQSIG
jgi:hypothetical protein